MRPVSLHAVRSLFLRRQHLAAPRTRALTSGRLVRLAEDTGGVQLDSIHVVERAHHLSLWARFGPYDRAWLERAVYRRRLLFEYWAHAACLVPRGHLPAWRRTMLDYQVKHTGWSRFLQKNPTILDEVVQAIRERGPLGSEELGEPRAPGSSGWWSWKPAQHALHYLWMNGTLAVHSRRHFQKRYDLIERALPEAPGCPPLSATEFVRWHVERSLHAMGAATDRDLAGYLTFPRFLAGPRRAVLRALLESGEVVPLQVEGTQGRWLCLARDLRALARAARDDPSGSATTLLSPFDSLLWCRERAARLFGFDYRIEVYTPADRRVHGYYTLPILHAGQLIGRVDAKTQRDAGVLEVRHVHLEPWFAKGAASPVGAAALDRDAALTGLVEALRSLAQFVGAKQLAPGRVTPKSLQAPLARLFRAS